MKALLRDGGRETVLETAFALEGGPAREVALRLERTGATLARARVAARLGAPDPFHVREALLRAGPDATVTVAGDGVPPTDDAILAGLVAAAGRADGAHDARDAADLLAGCFAFVAPGPAARAVPLARPVPALAWNAHGTLRGELPPPARTGEVLSWTTAAIGEDPVATVRCVQALPDGTVALGSDYGLTLARDGAFSPFPWPPGARREARRVEAMEVHDGRLLVATTQALYTWELPRAGAPLAGRVTSKRHPADLEDGYDDLNALCSAAGRLYEGWRTRLVGGVGPRDVLSFAVDPAGVVYAGTRQGELHVVDGASPFSRGALRAFGGEKARPVRHMAFARGALWVAADGALHRFDGAAWSALTPEPTALCVDPAGRLWALAEGALWSVEGPFGNEALVPHAVELERPWALGVAGDALWVGGRERVWRVALPR